MAAFRYHITRMHSLPLTPKKKTKRVTSIQLIARYNFPQSLMHKLNRQMQHKQSTMIKLKKERKTKLGQPSHTTVQK